MGLVILCRNLSQNEELEDTIPKNYPETMLVV